MEPKPLFPDRVKKSMVKTFVPKSAGSVTSNPTNTIEVKTPETKVELRLRPKFEKIVPSIKPPSVPEIKPLFPNRAISGNIEVDPFYKNHPLCANLNNKDIGRVRNIVMKADLRDMEYVFCYAEELHNKFSSLVNNIVEESTKGPSIKINNMIKEIVTLTQTLDPDVLLNPKLVSRWDVLLRRATSAELSSQQHVGSFVKKIESTVIAVDNIIYDFISLVKLSIARLDALDILFAANRENFDLLNLHIIAGRIIVDKYNNDIIPKEELRFAEADVFKLQELSQLKDTTIRFSRRIDNLDMTAHSMLQNIPQIRLMQSGIKNMAELANKLQHQMIPNWKMQVAALVNVIVAEGSSTVTEAIDRVKVHHNSTLLSIASSNKQVIESLQINR